MYFLLVLNFASVIYVLSINVKLLKKKIIKKKPENLLEIQIDIILKDNKIRKIKYSLFDFLEIDKLA